MLCQVDRTKLAGFLSLDAQKMPDFEPSGAKAVRNPTAKSCSRPGVATALGTDNSLLALGGLYESLGVRAARALA